MEEIFGVAEVKIFRMAVCKRLGHSKVVIFEVRVSLTCIEEVLKLVDVRQRPREPIDALNIQAKKVYSLDTLVHNHRHRQPISLIKPSQ